MGSRSNGKKNWKKNDWSEFQKMAKSQRSQVKIECCEAKKTFYAFGISLEGQWYDGSSTMEQLKSFSSHLF